MKKAKNEPKPEEALAEISKVIDMSKDNRFNAGFRKDKEKKTKSYDMKGMGK